MPAPPEILDTLESIIGIYFSNVRHRERAAFILCDNLVEMACKTKAVQHNHAFNAHCGFHTAWNAPGVHLPPTGLGGRVHGYRQTRNNMQHASAAATVDAQYCATAILDAVRVIDRCWTNTSTRQFPSWMRCALRIVQLYASVDDIGQRTDFEDRMRQQHWRAADREIVQPNARQIQPGVRDFWWIAIRMHTPLVEQCLNEIGVP
jgi:hypothetical protein